MSSQDVKNYGELGLQPHIVVLGAGAMGCYFGGMLLKQKHKVTFVDVNPCQIDAINANGILIETDQRKFQVPAKAVLAKDLESHVDLIIVFTKTNYTDLAMASIQHIISPHTIIMSLQNGLGNAERLAHYTHLDRVVVGTTLVPADLKGYGHVVSHGASNSQVMDSSLKHPDWLSNLVELFNDSGLAMSVETEIQTLIWSKVAFNAALNAICAITGTSTGPLSSASELKILAKKVVQETIMVGQANQVTLDENYIWRNVEMSINEHPDHKPSMLQDLLASRPTEIDYINNAIVRAAEKVGVEAPVNRTLGQLLRLIEQVNRNKT